MEEKLGSKYVIQRSLDFAVSYEESGAATPMFFILSPGVDPLKDVEKHGTDACDLEMKTIYIISPKCCSNFKAKVSFWHFPNAILLFSK